MSNPKDRDAAGRIPLLVGGIMLNVIGIALISLSPAGFVLSAAGILMILTFVIKAVADR